MFLLDTNFLKDLHDELRGDPSKGGPAQQFMEEHRSHPMAISAVTANEYAAGIHNEREARRFLPRFRLIALGRDIALLASRIDRNLSSKGLRLGENDTWQSAVALRFDLILVTDDSDFDRIPSLKHRSYRNA